MTERAGREDGELVVEFLKFLQRHDRLEWGEVGTFADLPTDFTPPEPAAELGPEPKHRRVMYGDTPDMVRTFHQHIKDGKPPKEAKRLSGLGDYRTYHQRCLEVTGEDPLPLR